MSRLIDMIRELNDPDFAIGDLGTETPVTRAELAEALEAVLEVMP